MARQARLAVAGYPHHLMQRGNDRQVVFRDDADRAAYLETLGLALREARVALHAWVLMDNHVHLLATPSQGDGLARLMHRLGTRYAGWFNHRHGRTGALWEGRFRSSLVETDAYLLACMRYVELNPVRAGLAPDAASYRWSSARHHLGRLVDPLVTEHPLFWSLGNTPFEREARWREFLDAAPPGEAARISTLCLHSRPLVSAAGADALGAAIGRTLAPRKRGRPHGRKPVPN